MKIIILGSGGREHALAHHISNSQLCEELYILPGNAGTADCGTNVSIGVNDFPAIASFCKEKDVSLIVVGPEDPLINGIYDYFQKDETLKHINVFGPSAAGANLEGSKVFAKEFMYLNNIPTAASKTFGDTATEYTNAVEYIRSKKEHPYVIKVSGPALGKGVLIKNTPEEAIEAIDAILVKKAFGAAGEQVVIEDFLSGTEFSVFVITDGTSYKILPVAKDYKRIGDGDTGLNTGGMGSISPVPFVNKELMEKVEQQIIKPTISGLAKYGLVYKGFIYFGLMNVSGNPFLIEYNCRLGDPETQVVLPRLNSDLLEHIQAVFNGTLKDEVVKVSDQTCAAVVLASGGYPGDYKKGEVITLPKLPPNTLMFHAGTKRTDGVLLTNGGRVLAPVAYGTDMEDALARVNQLADAVSFTGITKRTDIGKDMLEWQMLADEAERC